VEGGSAQPKIEQNRGGKTTDRPAAGIDKLDGGGDVVSAARLGGDRWSAVGGRWWQ